MQIVLATDGSQQAVDAAAYLRQVADPATVTQVVVVAVISPLAAVPFASDSFTSSSLEDMSFRRAAEAATQVLADALADWGPQVTTEVRSGSAAAELIRAARAHRAGLLVVAHRSGPIESRLLGSVAHRVLNEAPCPVLVVRPTS